MVVWIGQDAISPPAHAVWRTSRRRRGVDDGGQRTRVPRKPLRQEQVPGLAVDDRRCRVPQALKRIQAVESCPPRPPELQQAVRAAVTLSTLVETALNILKYRPVEVSAEPLEKPSRTIYGVRL